MAILNLVQFQFSLNKSEKSNLPLGQLAPVSPTYFILGINHSRNLRN
jgi:hypothetical protein